VEGREGEREGIEGDRWWGEDIGEVGAAVCTLTVR